MFAITGFDLPSNPGSLYLRPSTFETDIREYWRMSFGREIVDI
jgi:hypothetical protein